MHTFVSMDNVIDIKRQQKIVKKYGTIKFNDAYAVGELKITRSNIHFSPITGNATNCEIDVVYNGTINQWGRWMGPVREVNGASIYGRGWSSTIQRNKHFRRMVRLGIMDYLKYLGVYIPYQHNLTIKKIVWKESGI